MVATEERPDQPRAGARALRLAGVVVALLGVAFVVRSLVADWPRVSAALADAAPGWMGASVLLTCLSLAWIAGIWGWLLGGCGPRTALRWYFVGELAKYVPGGIWAVLGRSEFAVQAGARRGDAYRATLASLLATFGAALLVALVMAGARPELLTRIGSVPRWLPWVLAAGSLMGVIVAVRIVGRLGTLQSALALVLSIPAWLGVGAATVCVIRALGATAPWSEVLFATASSWFAGFAVVPVPSGIGVREAVLAWGLHSLPDGVAAATSVGARLSAILADLLGVVLLIAGRRNDRAASRARPAEPESSHPLFAKESR